MEDVIILDLEKSETDRKKKFLKRYRKNKALIDRLEDKIRLLDERLVKIKSPTFSDLPKGGNPVVTREDLLDEKRDLEIRVNRLKLKGKNIKLEITDVIDKIEDPRYAEVLELFLINCKSFDEIALECGYTKRHIERLYKEAIKAVPY